MKTEDAVLLVGIMKEPFQRLSTPSSVIKFIKFISESFTIYKISNFIVSCYLYSAVAKCISASQHRCQI